MPQPAKCPCHPRSVHSFGTVACQQQPRHLDEDPSPQQTIERPHHRQRAERATADVAYAACRTLSTAPRGGARPGHARGRTSICRAASPGSGWAGLGGEQLAPTHPEEIRGSSVFSMAVKGSTASERAIHAFKRLMPAREIEAISERADRLRTG